MSVEERNGQRVIVGHAATFNTRSEVMFKRPNGCRTPIRFRETGAPSAMNKTLADGAEVRAWVDHDPNRYLGRTGAGTLRLSVDDRALRYEVDVPNTPAGTEAVELIERRDITGSSFGFYPVKDGDEWTVDETGLLNRRLTEVKLRDVGPTPNPAYPDAGAALRHLAETRALDLEDLLDTAEAGELDQILTAAHDTSEESRNTTPLVTHITQRV